MSVLLTLLCLGLLLAVSWPLAIAVLVLWPVIWLITLPFRILGILLSVVLATVVAILLLPARLLRKS